MSDVQVFLALWAAGLFVFFVYIGVAFDAFSDMWNGFLNGFNWIVEHTMGELLTRCSQRTLTMEERIAQLERWSSQWNELRMNGYSPVWIDGYGWAENDGKCRHRQLWVRCAVCTAPDVRRAEALMCPCGYRTECAVHCGSGHTDGGCPEHNAEPTAVYPVIGVTAAEHAIRVTAGMTAREFADRIQEMYVRRNAR